MNAPRRPLPTPASAAPAASAATEPSVATPRSSLSAPNMVPLPAIPQTTSPVPWLTSLHATPGRGPYGDAGFPGNCSGLLIRDLLSYFRPRSVFDPMAGSLTCQHVCQELGIPCTSHDLSHAFDAAEPQAFTAYHQAAQRFAFVWLHPPYWNMIRYGNDPRCLSNAATLEEFLRRLRAVLENCLTVLAPGGHLALLMGDYRQQGRYLALPFHTWNLARDTGLELAAPEIVRFSHGASSAKKRYPYPFIPRLHDVCLVLKRSADGKSERAPAPRFRRSAPGCRDERQAETPDGAARGHHRSPRNSLTTSDEAMYGRERDFAQGSGNAEPTSQVASTTSVPGRAQASALGVTRLFHSRRWRRLPPSARFLLSPLAAGLAPLIVRRPTVARVTRPWQPKVA